jgi:hypothetical protein
MRNRISGLSDSNDNRPERGATVIEGREAMDSLALFTAIQAMEMHVKSGGRMVLTRIATPKFIAERFDLINPKTKKRPTTAKACLALLQKKKAEHDRMTQNDAQGKAEQTLGQINPRTPDVLN